MVNLNKIFIDAIEVLIDAKVRKNIYWISSIRRWRKESKSKR